MVADDGRILMNAKEISMILKSCKDLNLSKLKIGELEISFQSDSIKEPIVSQISNVDVSSQIEEYDEDALENEMQQENLILSDPEEWQKMEMSDGDE